MKKYVPMSQLPKEVSQFYDDYGDMYEEMIVTKNKQPLFNVVFKKGNLQIQALTPEDVKRAVDPETDNRSYTCTPNLSSFDNEHGVLNFATSCAGSRNAWEQRVQFSDEWELVPEDLKEPGVSWDQLKQEFPEVLDLNCRMHCTCPSFLYQFAYTVTQLDIQLVDEGRPNIVVNPDLQGIVCKHLSAVLRNFF